jgi:hypothetical protein
VAASLQIKSTKPKTGRNEPCPCGSGKKYKKSVVYDRLSLPEDGAIRIRLHSGPIRGVLRYPARVVSEIIA